MFTNIINLFIVVLCQTTNSISLSQSLLPPSFEINGNEAEMVKKVKLYSDGAGVDYEVFWCYEKANIV